LGHQ